MNFSGNVKENMEWFLKARFFRKIKSLVDQLIFKEVFSRYFMKG